MFVGMSRVGQVLVFSLITLPAWAVDAPTADRLLAAIDQHLPVGWNTESLRITAEANEGNEVRPRILQRFEADIAPSHDLFFLDDQAIDIFLPYLPIIPSLRTDDKRALYGVAESTFLAGTWNIELDLENKPFANTGKPIDFFEGPVIVRGSDEEARFLETFGDRLETFHRLTVERAVAEREAEVAARKAALDAELARMGEEESAQVRNARERTRIEMETAIESVRTAHQVEIGRLREEHELIMARRQMQQQQKLETLSAELESAEEISELTNQIANAFGETLSRLGTMLDAEGSASLEESRSRLTFAVESARAQHEAALAALQAEGEARLAQIRTEQEAVLEGLKIEHEKEVAVRNQQHQQRLALLASDMAEAEKLIEMAEERQETLQRLQRTMAVGLDADAERLRTIRQALASSDENMREAAIVQAIQGEDATLRGIAFKEIYSRPPMNMELRNLALRDLLVGGATFSFKPTGGNLQRSHLVSVSVTDFNQSSGDFKATIQASGTGGASASCGGGNAGSATGSLSNAFVAVRDSSSFCSINFTLASDGKLRGEFANTYRSLSGQVEGELPINLGTWMAPEARQARIDVIGTMLREAKSMDGRGFWQKSNKYYSVSVSRMVYDELSEELTAEVGGEMFTESWEELKGLYRGNIDGDSFHLAGQGCQLDLKHHADTEFRGELDCGQQLPVPLTLTISR